MEMFNPPHPGEIIREDCLKPLNLSVTAAAKGLGVSRQSLSELLNGRNGISADMALRLEIAGCWAAESWLRNQVTYDLWHAKQHIDRLEVTKFRTLGPADSPMDLRLVRSKYAGGTRTGPSPRR